jgi:branched-chain amino acid aminotransferase
MSELACLDGELMPVAQARIPVTDQGLLRGDGVFEVIRLYGGRPHALERHLDRMARSAENLRLPLDVAQVRADAALLLGAGPAGDCLLRVLATRGGHRVALLEPLPALPEALALASVTYAPTRVLDGVKSLSYAANMLAGRLARERGFDEALLVTPHGRVLECPTASFFWVRGGELHTPPLDTHVLDSITRRIVIEECGAHETETTLAMLEDAEEAFVSSTVRDVLAVSRIDERELAPDGPLTVAASAAAAARIAQELA